MSDKPQDLKPRTKAFALRIIRMYSKLRRTIPSPRCSVKIGYFDNTTDCQQKALGLMKGMCAMKYDRILTVFAVGAVAACTVGAPSSHDEARAGLLGRQCAVIWFASQSKMFQEAELEKDIIQAPLLAKALGVSYDEQQFRNAFKKTEQDKVISDFYTLFPLVLETNRNAKVRDIYLVSLWCHASRAFVNVVPLWREKEQQDTVRKQVASLLAQAQKAARAHHAAAASSLYDLGLRSLSDPIQKADVAYKLASDTWKVQKDFLQKFMTQDEAALAAEPLLLRKP